MVWASWIRIQRSPTSEIRLVETKILNLSLNPPALGSPIIFGCTPYLVNEILYSLDWGPEVSYLIKFLGNPIIKSQLWNYIIKKEFFEPFPVLWAAPTPPLVFTTFIYLPGYVRFKRAAVLSPVHCWSPECWTVLMNWTKILIHSKDRQVDARIKTPIQSIQGAPRSCPYLHTQTSSPNLCFTLSTPITFSCLLFLAHWCPVLLICPFLFWTPSITCACFSVHILIHTHLSAAVWEFSTLF